MPGTDDRLTIWTERPQPAPRVRDNLDRLLGLLLMARVEQAQRDARYRAPATWTTATRTCA